MLMFACVRIGVIHSVVFAGFRAGALADRIEASNSKVVFTADITFRKGTIVPLKEIVDSALKKIVTPSNQLSFLNETHLLLKYLKDAILTGKRFLNIQLITKAPMFKWKPMKLPIY